MTVLVPFVVEAFVGILFAWANLIGGYFNKQLPRLACEYV